MATATPPVRPKLSARTNQSNRKYWTLHTGVNNILACRPKDSISSVVAFRNLDEAVMIGSMIETHLMRHKEWPDFESEILMLPTSRVEELQNIFLQKWEFDDLKLICTQNMLDMISVEEINKRASSYTFTGNQYKFNAPLEFYQNRFNELLEF
jgi:hypothetical protein